MPTVLSKENVLPDVGLTNATTSFADVVDTKISTDDLEVTGPFLSVVGSALLEGVGDWDGLDGYMCGVGGLRCCAAAEPQLGTSLERPRCDRKILMRT